MTGEHLVYVQPGEIRWSAEPCVFKTVLGSCVSVCLWDPVRGVGGLTHFVLPSTRAPSRDARFADIAIPRLAGELRAHGCTALVAKLFGGAAVLPKVQNLTVGASNIQAAVDILKANNIEIVARRTGGTRGIVLYFASASGAVELREIRPPQAVMPDFADEDLRVKLRAGGDVSG
jgi:chemotaxis protein CheD